MRARRRSWAWPTPLGHLDCDRRPRFRSPHVAVQRSGDPGGDHPGGVLPLRPGAGHPHRYHGGHRQRHPPQLPGAGGGRPGAAGPGGQGGLRQDGHPDPRRARGDGGAQPVPRRDGGTGLRLAGPGGAGLGAPPGQSGGQGVAGPPEAGRPPRRRTSRPCWRRRARPFPRRPERRRRVFRPRGAPSSIWRWTEPPPASAPWRTRCGERRRPCSGP